MFTLGEPSILEAAYRAAGFRDVFIQAVPLRRRFSSVAEAVKPTQNNPVFQQLIATLSERERQKAWVEIEQEFSRFQGPKGVEFSGEFLIGVGTK